MARYRRNSAKSAVAKKAVGKTGAKIAAKGGARFIPGVGQVVMVIEGVPVAWEGTKRTGKAYKDTWKGGYQAAKDVTQAAKEGRYSEAAKRAGRGAKEGAVGSAKVQWEFTKGTGRTALAALIAKEAADATYYEDKPKKKRKKKRKKRMARKNKKMSLQDAQMLVAAAPHAAAGFSEQFRISAATGRETFAHLRKKELKKAAKRGAKGAKDSFTSQIKHAGRAAAAVGGGEQFEKALAQETEKFMTKPRMNPDFTLIKHPPGGARSRPPAKAPMSFNEYAVWRESPSVSIIGMMAEIPTMKRTPLNRLAGSDHPMAWMANYELMYRKELHQLRHGPRAIANPKARRNGPTRDRPHYPFAEKEEQYSRYSLPQLYSARDDAMAASRAQQGWDEAGANWYLDDYHTIIKEIRSRRANGRLRRNPRKKNPRATTHQLLSWEKGNYESWDSSIKGRPYYWKAVRPDGHFYYVERDGETHLFTPEGVSEWAPSRPSTEADRIAYQRGEGRLYFDGTVPVKPANASVGREVAERHYAKTKPLLALATSRRNPQNPRQPRIYARLNATDPRKRYAALKALAASGSGASEGERRNALEFMARMEKKYSPEELEGETFASFERKWQAAQTPPSEYPPCWPPPKPNAQRGEGYHFRWWGGFFVGKGPFSGRGFMPQSEIDKARSWNSDILPGEAGDRELVGLLVGEEYGVYETVDIWAPGEVDPSVARKGKAIKQTKEFAMKYNPRQSDVVRVDRPKGYQSHGWEEETRAVKHHVPAQVHEGPDGRHHLEGYWGTRAVPTGKTYKNYGAGTYFIEDIGYITGPSGGAAGSKVVFEVTKPDGQVVVVEGTQAEARYFADQDAKQSLTGLGMPIQLIEALEKAGMALPVFGRRRKPKRRKGPRRKGSPGYKVFSRRNPRQSDVAHVYQTYGPDILFDIGGAQDPHTGQPDYFYVKHVRKKGRGSFHFAPVGGGLCEVTFPGDFTVSPVGVVTLASGAAFPVFLVHLPLTPRERAEGDAALGRTAEANPRQSDVSMYQKVLAHLRALQWVYTTTHWTSAGQNAYGDHLLLERLYTGLGKPIDALGERMVAYFGPQSVDPVAINGIVQKVLAGVGPARLRLSVLLNLEHSTQTGIKAAWKSNQDSGDEMSLGIDNYLADLADQRDEAIYLLRQRLRG